MNAPGASELSRLVVIDRLEVGPAKVEGDRIAAPYRVGEDVFELAYKYEEPVLRILLQHAEGALRRSGRIWHPFDVLASAEIRTPYRLEAGKEDTAESPESSFLIGEMK